MSLTMPSPPPTPVLYRGHPKTPVCTKEGVVFDILNIMPYLKKHKRNPVTGEPLSHKDLLRLNFAKNADGKWHCPVTFKVGRTAQKHGPGWQEQAFVCQLAFAVPSSPVTSSCLVRAQDTPASPKQGCRPDRRMANLATDLSCRQ